MGILPRMDAYGVVYVLHNTTNGGVYVGQTTQDYRIRWRRHRDDLTRGVHHNPHLQRAWTKYGANAFTIKVVEVCANQIRLDAAERQWIASFRRRGGVVYNLKDGGSGGGAPSIETRRKIGEAQRGRVLSEVTRRKMREAQRGRAPRWTPEGRERINAAARRPRSEGHRRKIAATLSGRTVSEATRDKLRQHRHTEAHKERMREAMRGRAFSDETRQRMQRAAAQRWGYEYTIIAPDGSTYITYSLKQFCETNNLRSDCMGAVARGEQSNHRGWTCTRRKL